jgi:hypothetical protein
LSRVSLADVGTLHGRPRRSSGARIKIEVGPGGDLVHVIIHGEVFIVNPISSDQVPSR